MLLHFKSAKSPSLQQTGEDRTSQQEDHCITIDSSLTTEQDALVVSQQDGYTFWSTQPDFRSNRTDVLWRGEVV